MINGLEYVDDDLEEVDDNVLEDIDNVDVAVRYYLLPVLSLS